MKYIPYNFPSTILEFIHKNMTDQMTDLEHGVQKVIKSPSIAEWLDVPPHFLIDRIIQNKIGTILPWTNLDKTSYISIINNAQKLMLADGYTELAVWEANKCFEDYLYPFQNCCISFYY